ncbi:gp155R [Rabbit fibroma virus]|nr:gp155R [Rabbit fibroma virus]AAF18031.1 gp155R [Rabbit fibroma virus]
MYMYTGFSDLKDRTIDDIQSVIILADYLGIDKLVDECIHCIISKVDTSNCVGVYRFADTYHIENLRQATKTFLTEILLSPTDAFENLSQDDAVIVLKETYNVVDRRTIISVILLWVRKCPNRIKQIKALTTAIHDDNDEDDVYTIYERYVEELKDMSTNPLSNNCIATIDKERYICVVNPDTSWSKRVTYMSRRVVGDRFTVVCMDNVLYIIGGTLEGAPTSDVLAYDLITRTYNLIPEMGKYRRNSSACVVNGYIYVVGGIDQEDRLIGSVEYWKPGMDEWHNAPYLQANVETATVCYRNELWVAGGTVDLYYPTFINSVNRLTGDRWTIVEPLPEPRSGAAAVVYNDRLYCIGGRVHGGIYTSHVYRYLDESHTWERLSDMVEVRRNPICCVYNNAIYVLGGNTNAVEKYNGCKWRRTDDIPVYPSCNNTAYPFFYTNYDK